MRRTRKQNQLSLKGGEYMAEFKNPKDGFVDISSSTEVNKVYRPNAAQQERKRKRGKISFTVRIVSLVLSIIFLIAGAVVIYIHSRMPKYKALDNVVINDPKATSDESDANSGALDADNQKLLEHDEVLNILLFGQDYSGSKDSYGRSDTMILMSIDNINKKIKLTSFQRDTYVYIPGYGDDKINAAFSLGGEALAIKTLEANFGIKVDKYATVDFDSFRKIIRILGGIDIELNLEEIEYINAQIDVNHQQERGLTDFLEYDHDKELQVVHLDGYQALWYARDRGEERLGGNPNYSFSGDDWDRTHRQRNLIETIIKYLRTKASLADLIGIVNDVGPLITTNLKKDQIIFLAQNIMTYINYDMQQLTLPSEGNWRYGHTGDGQSVIVIVDWPQVKYDMAKFIYESAVVAPTQAATE